MCARNMQERFCSKGKEIRNLSFPPVPAGIELLLQLRKLFKINGSFSFHAAHRSFIEALSGYYNCTYTLLRNCLESAVRGAYYECLAHRKFRNNPNIPEITRKGRKGIDIEGDLEAISASIFDKLEVIEDEEFKREFLYHPNYVEMIEALKV